MLILKNYHLLEGLRQTGSFFRKDDASTPDVSSQAGEWRRYVQQFDLFGTGMCDWRRMLMCSLMDPVDLSLLEQACLSSAGDIQALVRSVLGDASAATNSICSVLSTGCTFAQAVLYLSCDTSPSNGLLRALSMSRLLRAVGNETHSRDFGASSNIFEIEDAWCALWDSAPLRQFTLDEISSLLSDFVPDVDEWSTSTLGGSSVFDRCRIYHFVSIADA
jgi:hypothetical protein